MAPDRFLGRLRSLRVAGCRSIGSSVARPPTESGTGRAQSEVVGVLLLTATVVLVVGVFGVFFLGSVTERASGSGPLVDADVNATVDRVSVTHAGGDTVTIGDLSLLLRGASASEQYGFDAGNVSSRRGDDDPERFQPGERFERDHGLGSGSMEVLVIHDPSNAILRHVHLDVIDRSGTPVVASFEVEPDEPVQGERMSFDARASTGAGGITAYEWDWDDGSEAETTTEPVADHAFSAPGEYTVSLTVAAAHGRTAESSRTVSVVMGPSIEATTFTDGDDDLVTSGDSLTITATVTAGTRDVESVTADASMFDAGDVALTDEADNGTYHGTFTVGESPQEGDHRLTVEVTDAEGSTASARTEDTVRVDVTPPDVTTFTVADESDGNFYFLYWEYVETYDVEWSAADDHLETVTVSVDRSGSTQEAYGGESGSERYSNVRAYRTSGREHDISVVATDAAGNRACRTVTDRADGSDPPGSAFESC